MPASVVLTSLGSAVTALGKIAEYLATPIRRQFTYMCCFDSNFTELETKSKEFKTTRQGVQMGVDDTHRKVRVVGPTVLAWLTKANEVTRDVERIMEDKGKVKEGCLKWWCPNLKLRYSLSRKAVKTTEVVVDLQATGVQYTKPSYSRPPVCMEVMPNKDFTEFESRRRNMEEIIKALKPDEINIASIDKIKGEINEIGMMEINLIGICGLPGVGKTKMVQEVGKRAKQERLFDEVPYVVVGQNPDLTKLQKCIGESLGIDSIGRFDDASTRASLVHERLVQDNKKILLIIDDVWEEFDLQDMGIPLGGSNKNFKMLYTSRNRRLWHDVQTKKEISLEPLSEDEAWQLFKEKAGNLVDVPNLQHIAKQIMHECGYLPLALVTIGSTLAKKSGGNSTKVIWEEMLHRLTCPSGTPADKRLLLSLETSYNYVEDEEAKRLFLLCCLFEEDKYISIEDLTRYGLGLSLFRGLQELTKVRRRVIFLVDYLISCHLLLDHDVDGQVKLHDVVRDMGIYIASRDKASLVSHGNMSEWPMEDTYEDYTSISVISQKTIEFREGLRCPNLQFLLLRCKNLDEMPCNFFDGIKILRVLVLIGYSVGPPRYLRNCSLALQSLRYLRTLCFENLNATLDNVSAIGDLEDLEILSLGGCSIDELPTEFGKLAKLRLLDLTDCKLRRIPPGVISCLVGLEELYMIDCGFEDWEGAGKEEGINASLREFESLSKLNTLEVKVPDAELWPQIPIFSELIKFVIEIEHPFRCVDWRLRRPKPNYLSISSLSLIHSDYGGLNSLLRRTECLALQGEGTSDLVRELFVGGPQGLRRLENLLIGLCATPKCLVNTMNLPLDQLLFPRLETLHLYKLTNLREIFHGPVSMHSFGKLTSLVIEACVALEEVIRIEKDEHLETKTIGFQMLQSLELRGLPNVVRFCTGVGKIHFLELKELLVEDVGFASLFPQEVSLPNLEKLELMNLQNLETLGHGPLSFGSLSKLKQIYVRHCDKLLYVFPSMLQDFENVDIVTKTIKFPKLESLDLRGLPSLVNFCREVDNIHFPELKNLKVEDVGFLSLFPQEVSLPNLEKLELINLQNLETLGHGPLSFGSLSKLKQIYVCRCDKLLRVFPSPPVDASDEGEYAHMATRTIEFPMLESLELRGLPSLVDFCRGVGKFYFPKLKELSIKDIGVLSLFPREVSLPNLEKLELINLQNLETLGHGPLSFGSLSKLNQISVDNCGKLLCVFPSQLLPTLQDLEELTVELEGVDVSEPNTDILSPTDITLRYLPKLNYISKRDPVVFKYIHSLHIFQCDSLRYVFAPTMMKSIPQLRELKISGCKALSRIVAAENGLGESSVDEVEFPQLVELRLQFLPSLVSFLPKVNTTPQPLFNEKVAIPSLKYLELQQLKNLSDIWFSELPTSSFSELKELKVIACENLRSTFHPPMVEALANLEKLVIKNCSKMKAVVDSEEKGQGREIDKAMFPQLREMELVRLPNLRMFCSFTCPLEFPLLSQVDICDCHSMDAFSLGHLSFPKLGLPETSSKDFLYHSKRFTEEQDDLEQGAGGDRVEERKEVSRSVEEEARGDQSERIKRIKGSKYCMQSSFLASFYNYAPFVSDRKLFVGRKCFPKFGKAENDSQQKTFSIVADSYMRSCV